MNDLLRQVADTYPRATSTEGLDDGCFYCTEWQTAECAHPDHRDYFRSVQLHVDDCLWARICREVGLSPLMCTDGHRGMIVTDRPPVPYSMRERPTYPPGSFLAAVDAEMKRVYAEAVRENVASMFTNLRGLSEIPGDKPASP